MRTTFPPEKLAVSKVNLDNTWMTLQLSIIQKFDQDSASLDPIAAPVNWREELMKALNAQKFILDTGYASYWAAFVDKITADAMTNLRSSLGDLAKSTAAGDLASWKFGQLTATDTAKAAFKTALSREYLGLDITTIRQAFDTEVDSVANTRRALWTKHDPDVLTELERKLRKQQVAYDTRLSDSLVPERQPSAFETVVDPKIERVSIMQKKNTIFPYIDNLLRCSRIFHQFCQGQCTIQSRDS